MTETKGRDVLQPLPRQPNPAVPATGVQPFVLPPLPLPLIPLDLPHTMIEQSAPTALGETANGLLTAALEFMHANPRPLPPVLHPLAVPELHLAQSPPLASPSLSANALSANAESVSMDSDTCGGQSSCLDGLVENHSVPVQFRYVYGSAESASKRAHAPHFSNERQGSAQSSPMLHR